MSKQKWTNRSLAATYLVKLTSKKQRMTAGVAPQKKQSPIYNVF